MQLSGPPADHRHPRAVLGATLQPGIGLILDLVGFPAALPGARLAITGEGFWTSTPARQGTGGRGRSRALGGIPVVAVAGRSLLPPADLEPVGILAAYALTDLEPDPDLVHDRSRLAAGAARREGRQRLGDRQ